MTSSRPQPELPQCLRFDDPQALGQPLDISDLAARLETEGVTDTAAAEEFGFEDTRHMAQHWLPRVITYGPAIEASAAESSTLKEFIAGIAFAAPLLCSCAATLWLGFGLWGGALSNEDATAAGTGTVGSFLVASGAVQAMVRRGLFYATTQQPALCAAVVREWMGVGVWLAAAGALTALAASEYWSWLPSRVNLMSAAFCLELASFWLVAGALYVFGKNWIFLGLNVAGIGLVWLLHRGAGWDLPGAQLTAVAMCTAVGFAAIWRRLCCNAGWADQARHSAHDLYLLWPYLLYGVLYYALLFSDRLMAWTADTFADALAVQFRGDYEAAVNLGLFVFVMLAGGVHCATAEFYRFLASAQKRHRTNATRAFAASVTGFYWRRLAGILIAAAALGCASLWGADAFALLPNAASAGIARWSVVGFTLLIAGLWNVNVLFSLSGAPLAAMSALAGCLVNLSCGYAASRIGGYEFAVLGFVAGSGVFAGCATVSVLRAFRNLDYRYFTAA